MSRKTKEAKEIYSFRIEPRIMKKLKMLAGLNDTTASKLVNDALLNYAPIKKYFTTR